VTQKWQILNHAQKWQILNHATASFEKVVVVDLENARAGSPARLWRALSPESD
jgi:hypothetical protein